MREANVKLNPKKCSFVKQKVEYLGHVVTPDGAMPNPEKVRVVQDFPVPKNLKKLITFMGPANYYRRFVKGFAYIANPLNALTKKGTKFEWTEACADAFDKVKRALISAPILAYQISQRSFCFLFMQVQLELALLLLNSKMVKKLLLRSMVAV